MLDDGRAGLARGTAASPAPSGRGLNNMQQRAQRIGATLGVTFASTGASVIFRLPLAQPGAT